MPAGRPPRKLRWVKLFIDEALDGTTRDELDPAQRGVWWDFVLLAGRYNDDGHIPVSRTRLCAILNVPSELLAATIQRCVEVGKLEETSEGLRVVNFTAYQAERWEEFRERERSEPLPDVDSVALRRNSLHKVASLKEERRGEERRDREEESKREREGGSRGATPALSIAPLAAARASPKTNSGNGKAWERAPTPIQSMVKALEEGLGYNLSGSQYRGQVAAAKELLELGAQPDDVKGCLKFIRGKDAGNGFKRQAPLNMALVLKYFGEYSRGTVSRATRNTTKPPRAVLERGDGGAQEWVLNTATGQMEPAGPG